MISAHNMIAHRIEALHARIHDAASAAGRDPATITLIAVSKTKPLQMVLDAITAGQKDFGENTMQDALTKIPHIDQPQINWHFIGHLQRNKAKLLPQHFNWWHSLDSLEIGVRVARAATESGRTVQGLVQVNITEDPNKYGIAPERLDQFVEELLNQDIEGLKLRGLMTIGPKDALAGDSAALRQCFGDLRERAAAVAARFGLADFDQLSMGMSGDYIEAIQEGATMIRVGSAIFGARG